MDPFNISSQHHPYLRPPVGEKKSKTDMDDRIVDLLELIIRYIIWFAAVMDLLKVFNIDTTPLLTAAVIVGITVALAAQDFISNFFGGTIITVGKQFKYYSEPDEKVRITIPISVALDPIPVRSKETLLEIAQDATKNSEYLLDDPMPTVFSTEFAESSLNFILRVWTRKYSLSIEVQDTTNCRVAKRFALEGIGIPFPQIDVHMKNETCFSTIFIRTHRKPPCRQSRIAFLFFLSSRRLFRNLFRNVL
jgi:MscS family membrane protein